MDCPKCGLTQAPGDECRGCGIIIARYRPPAAAGRSRTRSRSSVRKSISSHDSDLLAFYESMGQLLGAGLAPVEALESFFESASGLRNAAPYRDITAALAAGHTISQGMAASPGDFPDHHVAIVRAGEQAGALPDALRSLAQMLGQSLRTRTVIRRALRKPKITLLASVFILPVPQLVAAGLLVYLSSTLPLLAALLLTFFLLRQGWRLVTNGDTAMSRYSLRLPLVQAAQTNQFARVFHTLYRAGVPTADAYSTAATTCTNRYFCTRLQALEPGLRAGDTLTRVIREVGVFPRDFEQIVNTGEIAGSLDAALTNYLAVADERFETALARLVNILTGIVGTVVLVFVGYRIISGFIALQP